MEDKNLNRYEETEKKENPFVKVLKMFGTYLKNMGFDFITSFKYNNMKLAAILVAIPGFLFGFFLMAHYDVVSHLGFSTTFIDEENFTEVTKKYLAFDFSGIAVFVIMLFSVLNIFSALSMSGKKNLGSVVTATVIGAIVIAMCAAYLFLIFYFVSLVDSGKLVLQEGTKAFTNSHLISVISVGITVVCTIAGVILGYINYDRTYEKVNR